MTEPPQPPNQPPTPSGYGHLPGPPQPGYGHPPQGVNPYAQQPPTAPGQGYAHGYPPPPPPPGPGPFPPPGTPPKKKRTLLVAGCAAAVLVAAAAVYAGFFAGGDDPKKPVAQESAPADAKPSASASVDQGDGSGNGSGEQEDLNAGRKQGEDKVLWLKTATIDGPGMGVDAEGQWVVGDTVVKRAWKNLTGYAVTDGKEKWTLAFPAAVCAVTGQTTADGKTVVMYRDSDSDSASCTQMRVVDLKTGKEVWSKEVPKEGLFDIFTSPTLAITGDTVAISRGGTASAFKVSSGDKLFASNQVAEGCKPDSYAAGNGAMIALATCADDDSTAEVQGIDPATGKKSWTFRLAKGVKVTSLYSVNPPVLDLSNEATKQRSIVVLGPDGKQTATLAGEGEFAVGCGDTGLFRSLTACPTAVVDSNTLYLPTTAKTGEANEIVAFDLSGGKAKWRVPAGDKRTLRPLGAAGGRLIAYRLAEEDRGGEILSIPADGGAPTALLRNPSGPAAPIESSFRTAQADFVDGRFFLSVSRLRAQGKEERLLMAFGK